MKKKDLEHFYNEGFGWICKRCEAESKSEKKEKSRLLTEGEAESKTPVFSNKAMARWADSEHTKLICNKCGIEENL